MAGNYGRTETTTQRELISLNGMLANPSVFDPAFNLKHGAEQQYPSTRTVLEAHEVCICNIRIMTKQVKS